MALDLIELDEALHIAVDEFSVVDVPHSFDENLDAADGVGAGNINDMLARHLPVVRFDCSSIHIDDCIISKSSIEAIVSLAHMRLVHHYSLIVHLQSVRLEIGEMGCIDALVQIIDYRGIYFRSKSCDGDRLVRRRGVWDFPICILLEQIPQSCVLLSCGPLLVYWCIIVVRGNVTHVIAGASALICTSC